MKNLLFCAGTCTTIIFYWKITSLTLLPNIILFFEKNGTSPHNNTGIFVSLGEKRKSRPDFENFRVTISAGGGGSSAGRDAPERAASTTVPVAGTPSLSESEGGGEDGGGSKSARKKRNKRKKDRGGGEKRKRLEKRLAKKEAELRRLAERDVQAVLWIQP